MSPHTWRCLDCRTRQPHLPSRVFLWTFAELLEAHEWQVAGVGSGVLGEDVCWWHNIWPMESGNLKVLPEASLVTFVGGETCRHWSHCGRSGHADSSGKTLPSSLRVRTQKRGWVFLYVSTCTLECARVQVHGASEARDTFFDLPGLSRGPSPSQGLGDPVWGRWYVVDFTAVWRGWETFPSKSVSSQPHSLLSTVCCWRQEHWGPCCSPCGSFLGAAILGSGHPLVLAHLALRRAKPHGVLGLFCSEKPCLPRARVILLGWFLCVSQLPVTLRVAGISRGPFHPPPAPSWPMALESPLGLP